MRRLALAAIVALLPAASGCHFPISTEVTYHPEGEPARPHAKARNELTLGLLPLALAPLEGKGEADEDAGNAKEIGRALADAIEDARIFAQVRYPLRDETVDVVIEPRLAVDLSKHRLRNALSVFPGLLLPWIDGFGFHYDHVAVLELVVKDAQGKSVCDRHSARSEMLAERYPSILWWLGLHAGLLILLVFESATTDNAVRERLIEHNTDRAIGDDVAWLAKEFSPEAKACPDHPNAPVTGKFCVYCRRNLWYPILNRHEGAPVTSPRNVTDTAR